MLDNLSDNDGVSKVLTKELKGHVILQCLIKTSMRAIRPIFHKIIKNMSYMEGVMLIM